MKKILFVTVLALLAFSACKAASIQPQELKVSLNITLRVGDTIKIGPASSYYNYVYILKDVEREKPSSVEPVNRGLTSRKYTIKDLFITHSYVKDAFYPETKQIISFGVKSSWGVTYYADIDGALKSGEIIIKENKNEQSTKLTDKIAFLYYVNKVGFSDKLIEEYLFRYMNDVYTQTKNDEFEYHKSLNTAKEQLVQNLGQLDSSKEYRIAVQLTLGNYDFEEGGFPIQEEDNLAYRVVPSKVDLNRNHISPISITFSNFPNFRLFKIPEDDANWFIKKRKDKYGNINREIYALINFNITNNHPNNESGIDERQSWTNTDRQLIGQITSIELYEYESLNVLIGIIE